MKNPLFESLISQASSYKRDVNPVLYEQTGEKLDAEVTKEYTKKILDQFNLYLDTFITSSPSQKVLSEAIPLFIDGITALSKENSVDKVFNGLNDIWKKCYDLASKSKMSDTIMPFYDKANECIKYMMEAYKALKEASGDQLNEEELGKLVKQRMVSRAENLKSRIASNKETIDAGKKEGENK